MKDDKKEGKEIGFYENGKLQYECFFSSGEFEGEYIFYNDDGSIAYKKYYE